MVFLGRSFEVPGSPAVFSLGRSKADRHMQPFFVELLPPSAVEKTLSSREREGFEEDGKDLQAMKSGREARNPDEGLHCGWNRANKSAASAGRRRLGWA
jgi:hypothetical protein